MKILRLIFEFVLIAVKGIFLALKLVFLIIFACFEKTKSKHCFRKQLAEYGLPIEFTDRLTESYGEMVSFNVFSYVRRGRRMR